MDNNYPNLVDSAVQAEPKRTAVRDAAVQADQHHRQEAAKTGQHHHHRQGAEQAQHPHHRPVAAHNQLSWQPHKVRDAFLPDTEYYRHLKEEDERILKSLKEPSPFRF